MSLCESNRAWPADDGFATEDRSAICPEPDGVTASALPQMHWLGGWAVREEAMAAIASRHLPQFAHHVYAPTPERFAALRAAVDAPDSPVRLLGGYSTGAFLLLRDALQWPVLPPLRLFAPFIDFRAESGLGGRVATARLKILLRRLRSAPLAAVADFYAQSGLSLPALEVLPYAADDLLWGIEQLAQTQAECKLVKDASATATITAQGANVTALRAWVGTDDALLDAERIAALLPICTALAGVGHDFEALLAACVAGGGFAA